MSANTYQLKKGDTLDKVAKANGLKNGDAIWKDPANKGLVKQRGRPEQLQPGDRLVLPSIPAGESRKALEGVVKKIETTIALTESKCRQYDLIIKDNGAMTKQIVAELKDTARNLRSIASKIDLAIFGVNIAGAVTKIVKLGMTSIGKNAAELAKLNKESIKEAGELVKEPGQFTLFKVADSLKDSENRAVALASTAVTKIDDWTSPTFWTYAIIRKQRGASWSDAVMTSIGDDIDEQIKTVEAESRKREAVLTTSRMASEQVLAIWRKQLAEAEAKLKAAPR